MDVNEQIRKYYSLALKQMNKDPKQSINNFKKALSYTKTLSYDDKRFRNSFSNIIVGIGLGYENEKNKIKACNYYKKFLNNKYITKAGLSAIYNNLGIIMNNDSDAEKYYNKSIKLYSYDPEAHYNLAHLYKKFGINSKDKSQKLLYFKKSISNYNTLVTQDRSNREEYNIEIIKLSIIIINMDYYKDGSNLKLWLAGHIHSDINPLIVKDNSDVNDISEFTNDKNGKDNLINLFKFVADSIYFLNNHLRTKLPKNNYLYQYTSINTLKSICDVDKKFNDKSHKHPFELRLYNSDYMNDPLEGKELLKHIVRNNNSNIKNIIDIVYHNNSKRDHHKNTTELHASHVYIASLSFVAPGTNDAMPLWNSYGDDHKGIALGLKVLVHKSSNRHNKVSNSSKLDDNYNKIPLNLYKVSYDINDAKNIQLLKKKKSVYEKYIPNIDNNDNLYKTIEHELNDINNRITNIKYLKDLCDSLSKIPLNIVKSSHISNLIKISLDRIRFLSKTGAFKYENEYRIMEEIPNFDKTKYDVGNEKLYINLSPTNGNVTASLKQIVFGNRCKSYYWVPMVEKQLKGVKIFKSNIKYR